MTTNAIFDDPANQGNAVDFTDEELAGRRKDGETDEDFRDRIDKQQQMAKERFAMADLEEKLQLSDDPMALIAKELKAMRSLSAEFIATNADLQEQIDELHDRPQIQLRGEGDADVYPDDEEGTFVIDSGYRGPHQCYAQDSTVLWNKGGYITVGNSAISVVAADITGELEADSNRYLKYRLTINSSTGVVTQDYVSSGTRSAEWQSQTVIHIPLIKYSKPSGTGIVTVQEQMLTEEPTVYTWKHTDQDSGTVYGLNYQITINTQHNH